ncbi:hypothetical protein F4692_001692 [Nocardioides cavernae]|uniref:Uncharacterized protein n=1 Tax=Nocardioides cavernae TaxID=1921566 RepID=A0A7Y9H248_9ACTN|nr:hypothetical protein [Nocardioides cavernae]NYE36559.1 hypothetical protein [Nocardioides cavernae]
MVWLLGALVLAWVAWGPVVLLVAAGLLCVPRVRWWVQDRVHVSRRVAAWAAGAVAVLAAAVLVVPDGWLPIPPAPGVWAGPAYVGRPANPHELAASTLPQNPHRAVGDPVDRPGPLGRQPEVDTGWFGLQHCGRLALASSGSLVALCTSRSGQVVRLVDPDSLRPTATQELPERPDGSACTGDSYLDAADRLVVAAGDRVVLAVGTVEDGKQSLGVDATWDLRPYVPYGDCVVALAPDFSGRIWWASAAGLTGTLDPATEQVGVIDLGEEVRRGIATDEGGAYVVTDTALHRLAVGVDGTPQPVWRSEYAGASGSAPVLLPGGAVAITDEVEDRLGVAFLARDDGRVLCRQSVFDKGDGATASDLAVVGSGVVVTNNKGYASPRSALLGFTTQAGIARVDLVDGGCVVSWTSDAVSPSGGVVASRPNGLVYAWTKRPSLTGVSAWYLTAIDATTGRSRWSVRTGTGLLAGNDGSQVLIGAGGTAWAGTLAGLVRVRDRG